MGSSSDDEHREIEVDEIEEENLVEDEKLLNDTKKGVEWNHKESQPLKIRCDEGGKCLYLLQSKLRCVGIGMEIDRISPHSALRHHVSCDRAVNAS